MTPASRLHAHKDRKGQCRALGAERFISGTMRGPVGRPAPKQP